RGSAACAVNSLRLRLVLVLAAVVATAMGVVFLYVVPTLRDNLVANRMKRLEQVAHSEQARDTTLQREVEHLTTGGSRTPGSRWATSTGRSATSHPTSWAASPARST